MIDAAIIAQLKAEALNDARKAAGGNTGLSRALSGRITPQAISQWKQVPADRTLDVERATGVSRYRLRPDLYPRRRRAPEQQGAA